MEENRVPLKTVLPLGHLKEGGGAFLELAHMLREEALILEFQGSPLE